MDEAFSFGRWLKVCRVARRLTQAELAAQTGYATVTIRKLESDDLRPSQQIAVQLAAQFELTPEAQAALIRFARGETHFAELHLPIRTAPEPHPIPGSRLPLRPRHHTLPADPTPLLGRERELEDLRTRLLRPDVRLVTLTGPGGIGKTRLAVQLARELPPCDDGVCFVDLTPIHEADRVAATVAQALDVREAADQPLQDRLEDYLRDKHLLLVLDNFEQVIAAASLVTALQAACPRLTVLVTSRAPLRLRGEQVFPVPPLPVPAPPYRLDAQRLAQYPAAALFTQRAQDVRPDFVLTDENAPAVAAICTRLDGLPLAIELAAARSQLLPPEAILARLIGLGEQAGSALQLLTGGARDLPARQQTLRTTIAWSHDLLTAAEQQLFRRLAVFVGGFTLATAAAVCAADGDRASSGHAPESDILDGVASLLDNSLLRHMARADTEPRLTMFATIREYALEGLAASGEAAQIQHQHAQVFLRLAAQAEPQLGGVHQLAWLTRLMHEYDNLRAALSWGLTHPESGVAIELAGTLWRFWQLNGDWTEAGRWLRAALAHSGGSHDSLARAKALCAASICDWLDDDMVTAGGCVAESVAIFQARGEQPGLALALSTQALVLMDRGDGTAQRLSEEAVALARAVGDPSLLEYALHIEGELAYERGDAPAAQAALEACVVHCRTLVDRWRLLLNLRFLSYLALAAGNYADAATLIDETLRLAQELGNTFEVAVALHAAGQIAQGAGDVGLAMTHYAASLALFREQGRPAEVADALLSQAAVWQLQAAYGRATALLREALLILKDTTNSTTLAACLTGIAAGACAQRQPLQAARLLGAGHSLNAQGGTSLVADGDRWANDQVVAETRAQLDAATFTTAWTEGQALTREHAIAYALDVLGS